MVGRMQRKARTVQLRSSMGDAKCNGTIHQAALSSAVSAQASTHKHDTRDSMHASCHQAASCSDQATIMDMQNDNGPSKQQTTHPLIARQEST